MVKFKKGDRVIVSGEPEAYRNGTGVIEDVGGRVVTGVRLDTGMYIAAKIKNVKHYKEDSVSVKVGDTVVLVSDEDIDITIGNEYVVIGVSDGTIQFCDDDNFMRSRDISRYRAVKTATPPQKITQNGYEYSLVGPVKPEWLVDGAWVVNVYDGEKRLVKEERPGVFNLCVNDLVSIRYHDGIRNQYRPHKPKDWKWGDWAMYDGKRVFVTGEWKYMGERNLIAVTHPSFTYTVGFTKGVSPSDLTPTF